MNISHASHATVILALGALTGLTGRAEDTTMQRYWSNARLYESATPVLSAAPTVGFHGRFVEGLEWINAANAVGDENCKTWHAHAWRNECVHGQFVVWTDVPRVQLRARVQPLVSADGQSLPAKSVQTRFVRMVHAEGDGRIAAADYGDCLDTIPSVDLPTNGFRAVWLTVHVPADARPGTYCGSLELTAGDRDTLSFPVVLDVSARTLPEKTAFFLDLWQMPWSIARYHGVKPYSPIHFELLRPYLKELAAAGQRAIMTFVVDDLWPCYDSSDTGNSMVEYYIHPDGRRTFDFATFDSYVTFAKACGIGPQIHCYSFVRFQDDRRPVQTATYTDAATGVRKTIEFHGFDDPAWEQYWGPLATALERHAHEKGWTGDVYVAIDEMSVPVIARLKALLAKWAPTLKIQFANDKPYSEFARFDLDNFSQAMRKDFMSEDLFAALAPRRTSGKTTTFYVCAGHPMKPNSWTNRPAAESEWLAIYAAANGFDGFLRWAAFLWRRDPFLQIGAAGTPGEAVFFYPGCLASVRWERLRDGIENFDKIRQLRAEGALNPALEAALKTVRFAPNLPDGSYAASVEAVNRALLDCIR